MIPVNVALSFVGASLLLAITPGPDNLFVLTQSMMHGWRRGLLVVLGLCTGLLVHTTVVALGLATVFKTSLAAFTTFKIVGAGYLFYLAWQAWRAPVGAIEMAGASEGAAPAYAGRALYARGVIMSVSNPKLLVFFLAFLPPFANPARGNMALQFVMLGGLFLVSSFCAFALIAVAAGSIGRRLQRSVFARKVLLRASGCVFAALGLWLLFAQRGA